jgi:F-type H+-transporting ATPase subunit b
MILVGFVFVFLLYKALDKFVFAHYIQHLELREGATSGARTSAISAREQAQALRANYDQRLFQARVEAARERVAIVARARQEATEIVAAAEAEAAGRLADGRKKIAQEMEECQSRADVDATSIAEMLTTKVDSELTVH